MLTIHPIRSSKSQDHVPISDNDPAIRFTLIARLIALLFLSQTCQSAFFAVPNILSIPPFTSTASSTRVQTMATFTEQAYYGGAIKGIIPQGWMDSR